MKRIFYDDNGEVVAVNYPHKDYLGGVFIDDVSRPIIGEVDDLGKPIFEYVKPAQTIIGMHLPDERVLIGYEKKTAITGYEQKELTIEDCPVPERFKQYDFIVSDAELPAHEYTNQLIVKNGAIEVDSQKTKTVMPPKFIKAKELAYQSALIDSELAKASPNAVDLVRAQRKIEQVKLMSDSEAYELALNNLSRAEISKPEIQGKLESKIASLQEAKTGGKGGV